MIDFYNLAKLVMQWWQLLLFLLILGIVCYIFKDGIIFYYESYFGRMQYYRDYYIKHK